MPLPREILIATLLLCCLLPASCSAPEPAGSEGVCQGYGPQTPRDIDDPRGENPSLFSLAPSSTKMNLCNLHFHRGAEHKAEDFSLPYEGAEPARYGGFRCAISESLTAAELSALEENHCRGVEPGDTIEVHWVHTSCDVEPGKDLDSCLSASCSNPDLRVESQVFVVVNDASALDFSDFAYDGNVVDGYHQAKSLPADTGTPIDFLGSTTGPSFSEQRCSPLQVSWSVRPRCAKLDLRSLSEWCADNVFEEARAHGVRQLVTDPRLLARIP